MTSYDDLASLSALSKIDPELAEALKKLPPRPPMDVTDITTIVSVMRPMLGNMVMQRAAKVPVDGLSETTQFIPMRDGYQNELRVFKSMTNQPKQRPLVVLVYGGGFALGDNQGMTPVARAVASVYGALVVNVTYRLAPEHTFLTQPNDVWDSLSWITENASMLGASPEAGFTIGGESAGANLCACAAVKMLRNPLAYPLTGVWLSVPALFEEENVPAKYKDVYVSRQQDVPAPGLNEQMVKALMATYKRDVTSVDFSPVNDSDGVSGHPPTLIQVCGLDPVRDDGLIYEKILKEKGVETKLHAYPGVIHGVWLSFQEIRVSQQAMLDSVNGIGWLLKRDASREEIKRALGPLVKDM